VKIRHGLNTDIQENIYFEAATKRY